MKIANKAFLILAVAVLAAMVISALWRFIPLDLINRAINVPWPTWFVRLCYSLISVVYPIAGLVIHVSIAVWLFVKARVWSKCPWFWVVFALTSGPLALAIFYLIEINRRLTNLEKCKTEPTPGN